MFPLVGHSIQSGDEGHYQADLDQRDLSTRAAVSIHRLIR